MIPFSKFIYVLEVHIKTLLDKVDQLLKKMLKMTSSIYPPLWVIFFGSISKMASNMIKIICAKFHAFTIKCTILSKSVHF